VPGAELGLTLDAPAGPGVGVAAVRPGSAGADAGLRPGDRLLRVGDAAVTSAAAAARALAAADTAPAFLVFQRGAVVRGALTPARGDAAGRAPGGGAP
jgi:S1-C subfamily serine protease